MKLRLRSFSELLSVANAHRGVSVGAFSCSHISSSVETLATPALGASLPAGWIDNLYNRVMVAGDPRGTVVPILDRWIMEGNTVEKRYLQGMIKQMKASRRYRHGLEVSKWMSDKRYFHLTPGDHADRLDLIHGAHSLEHAEKYFDSLPTHQRVYQTHGALLSCYSRDKCVEKAEALFERMRELNMLRLYAYNTLMKLYTDIGQLGKVETVFQQMKKDGFVPDFISHGNLMEAYAKDSNIEGIRSLMKSIREFPDSANWHTYAMAAKAYGKAGLVDEALPLVLRSKELIPRKRGRVAFGFLLSVCAEIGNKSEMYRIWNLYKSNKRIHNTVHMCMMSGLLSLDDVEGAEDVFKEWESERVFYDFRVPNILLTAYCKRGLVDKAESLLQKALGNGSRPYANTWDKFAGMYFLHGHNSKAVDTFKKALLVGESPWMPNHENVIAALEYLKEQKDVDEAEAFADLLRRYVLLTREHYSYLMSTYLAAGRSVTELRDRIKSDGFDPDEEIRMVLENKGN